MLETELRLNTLKEKKHLKEVLLMSDSSHEVSRKGDQLFDALAAVVLVAIFIVTVAYWVSSQ